MDWTVSPQNSYVKAQIHKLTAFENSTFKEVIKVK